MAEKINISYAQIRNIKDMKTDKPGFSTTIKFFNYFNTDKEKRSELLKSDYPDMFEQLSRQEERAPVPCHDPEIPHSSTLAYRIFSIADCVCGLKRSLVAELWGEDGLAVLDELSDKGLLVERDGISYSTTEVFRNTDRSVNREKQRRCLEIVDLDDTGDGGSWLSTITESLSESAYREVREKVEEVFFEIDQLVRDPGNHGNTPFFINVNLGKFINRKRKVSQ